MPSILKLDTIKSTTGNEAITINEAGVAAFTNIPLLFAYRSSGAGNQTVTNNTSTKAQLDTVEIDTHSWWDAANYRYIPQIPGYYRFDYAIGLNGTTVSILQSSLLKNGATIHTGFRLLGTLSTTVAGMGGAASKVEYMNGTTDYVEVWGQINASSGTNFFGSSSFTYLQAQLIQRTA
jgi:hypothetical protein